MTTAWPFLGLSLLALACAAEDESVAGTAGGGGGSGGASGHAGKAGSGSGRGGAGGVYVDYPDCTGLTCDTPDTDPTTTKQCSVPDNSCANSVFAAGRCGSSPNNCRCVTSQYYCCDTTWSERPCDTISAGGGGGDDQGGAAGAH